MISHSVPLLPHDVLLVEDNAELRENLAEVLSLRWPRVACTDSAEGAIEWLSMNSAALILTDQRLPGMTGLSLAQKLRFSGVNTPIVLMTAYASAEAMQQIRRFRVSRVLSKPVAAGDLFDALSLALGEGAGNAHD